MNNIKSMLKKKISMILTAGMILSSALGVNFETGKVYADAALPGAHHAVVGDDVFLGGNYIEVGVNKHGSFGTASAAPAGFHPSSRPSLGMVVDGDGFDVGNPPNTGDFFLPGTPYESYVVAYKDANGVATKAQVAEPNGTLEITNISTTDTSSGNTLSATTVGTTNDGKLQITQVVSFDVNDKCFNIHVTYHNVSGDTLYDARYLRSVDPDQDADTHDEYSTKNSVIKNPPKDDRAVVIAKGAVTNEPFVYIASDSRARASITTSIDPYDPTCYDVDGSKLLAPETIDDTWIAMTYALGDIAPGGSVSLDLKNSLNPDINDALEEVTVTTVSAIQAINVANGTTQGDIGLPTNVDVMLSDSSTTSAAIVWDNGTPPYDGNTAGTYAFTGTLTLPSGVTNPKNLKVAINVVVKAKEIPHSGGGSSSSSGGGSTGTTVTGSVVEGNTGNKVSNITANVTTNSNGNKTVSMKASDAVLLKQPNGSTNQLKDISKVDITTAEGSPVKIYADGTVKIENLAKGTDNNFKVTYDLGNGQKIVIGKMNIKVGNNGEVSLTSTLIDPYGVITDVTTGKVIDGVNVTLYYANTDRNKAAGKTPDTVVSLPTIDGFKPNDNKNPQVSDSSGAYGFMVFPTADYYLVATKEGYHKYISPIISVEQEIIKWDFRMNPENTSSQTKGVQRLFGQTRIDTALSIAKATYPGKVSNVVLVDSEDYPDALSGSVLAYKLNAPMLLIGSRSEDKEKVLSYMKSNMDAAGMVYLLGGEGVLSKDFESKVISTGFKNITRLGGADRYETSEKISKKLNVNKETPVFIVSGENYPDALSISSIAAVNQYPILLARRDEISNAIKNEISAINPTKVFIIGLQGSISSAVENNIAQIIPIEKSNITRIGGSDRFETSLKVAKYFNLTGNNMCIATGNGFPDALVGSIYAAKYNAPIMLVGKSLSDNEILYLKDSKLSGVTIFGGEGVVSKDIQQQISELVSK